MVSYKITGGKKAYGEVNISGNKNAALPLIAASLLTDDEVILNNVPNIEDVKTMLSLLKDIGSSVEYISKNSIKIRSQNRNDVFIKEKVSLIRGSILFLGPLLATIKKVVIPPPGGDIIGLRRIDTHFIGLRHLGADCLINSDGNIEVSIDNLKDSDVFLDEASVTATENLIMACALGSSCCTIRNAACEPHVQDLCRMLIRMGCKIEGVGSNLLVVHGAKRLSGVEFTLGCDFMEVGSFVGLAAATGGEVVLHNVDHSIYRVIRPGFEKIGIKFCKSGISDLIIPQKQERKILKSVCGYTNKIEDAPWPGFPADLLSIVSVCATQMDGQILVHEKMFESRMFFIDWLIRMGADIILCDPHRAVINGPVKLNSAQLSSPDVRAGMALVIAACCAEGTSEIQNIYQIERGYEDLDLKLHGLGLLVDRVESNI